MKTVTRTLRSKRWFGLVAGSALFVSLAVVAVASTEPDRSEVGPSEDGQSEAIRIRGDYAEARTCDVWTGPCFANGEINISGDHAVLAWSITEGSFGGVALDGLKVVAALDAQGTFGSGTEGKVRAVLFLDRRANERQRKALTGLVRKLAPKWTKNIVRTAVEPIVFRKSGSRVEVEVGRKGVVKLVTAPLMAHCDKICGNETQYYPALTKVKDSSCAKSVTHRYHGSTLGLQWSDPGARSAVVGRFEL